MIYLITPIVLVNAFQVDYSDSIRNGFNFASIIAIFIHFALITITKILTIIFKFSAIEKHPLSIPIREISLSL